MPTILIGGYYGAGNLGDEAILASMLNDLRSQRPDLSFIVTSWNPEKTARDYDVDAFYWKDINALLDAGQRADLVILGGGGLFFDYWGLNPDTYLRKTSWDITAYGSLPLLAKLLDIPCMIYAVGVGPLNSDLARQHACLAFERSQIATVRDVQSFELLKQIGLDVENPDGPQVEILPDPVFSMTTTPDDDAQADKYITSLDTADDAMFLGISMRHWSFEGNMADWMPNIANGLREFLNQNQQAQVILMPFQVLDETSQNNDALVLKDLADLVNMPDRMHLVTEFMTPGFAQALIKRCTAVLGMRLHSLIMGINAGTPVVALPYDLKVRSVMALAGLEKFCCESLSPQANELSSKIQDAWDQSQALRASMTALRTDLSQAAQKHAVLALGLLAQSHRNKLHFSQEFALEQVRLLLQADEKFASLQSQNQEIQTKNWSLQSQNQEIQSQNQEIQTQIWSLQSQNQEIQAQNLSLQNQNQEIQTQIWSLQSQNQEIQTQNWSLQSQLETLQNDNEILQYQKNILSARIPDLEIRSARLHALESSRAWRVAKIYYRIVSKPPLKYMRRFVDLWLDEGLKAAFEKGAKKLRSRLWPEQIVFTAPESGDANTVEVVENVVATLNSRALQGIVVVTSSFVFDELYNQRIINFSKFLSAKNWGVIYVAWRWSKQEAMSSIGGEVYKNIFQIPVDMLLGHLNVLTQVQNPKKYFFVEFPHPDFLASGLILRRSGFEMVYEIIDEWEEFHNVGQAIWFNKSVENALVINSNFLTAVSRPLIEKFSGLRTDIHLSPNGYTPKLLGEKYRNVSRNKQTKENQIHLGYFGHLTEAWFDWDFLIKVLELASESNINLHIHLIGYGEPDLQTKLAKYWDRVKFYGKVHPTELHKYVKDWDAALICFQTSNLSEAVDPIKIYEYLYFGLPIIAKGISHLQGFPATQVVTSEKQALDALISLKDFKRDPSSSWNDKTVLEQTLANTTWEQRFTDLLKILEGEQWMSL